MLPEAVVPDLQEEKPSSDLGADETDSGESENSVFVEMQEGSDEKDDEEVLNEIAEQADEVTSEGLTDSEDVKKRAKSKKIKTPRMRRETSRVPEIAEQTEIANSASSSQDGTKAEAKRKRGNHYTMNSIDRIQSKCDIKEFRLKIDQTNDTVRTKFERTLGEQFGELRCLPDIKKLENHETQFIHRKCSMDEQTPVSFGSLEKSCEENPENAAARCQIWLECFFIWDV